MCHVVLLMPVIGLMVFLIWPFGTALPVYLVIFSLSGLLYFAILRAMQRPVRTGNEGLIGNPVEIIDIDSNEGHVRVHGEIWKAAFEVPFRKTEKGRIKAIRNMILIIEKASSSQDLTSRKTHHH